MTPSLSPPPQGAGSRVWTSKGGRRARGAMAAPVAARSRLAPPLTMARLLAWTLLLLATAGPLRAVTATAPLPFTSPPLPPQRHERGYCAMYGVCGEKSAALGGGEGPSRRGGGCMRGRFAFAHAAWRRRLGRLSLPQSCPRATPRPLHPTAFPFEFFAPRRRPSQLRERHRGAARAAAALGPPALALPRAVGRGGRRSQLVPRT